MTHNHMEDLKARLLEENEAVNLLAANINSKASVQIYLKSLVAKKKLEATKQEFAAFEQQQEDKAEEIMANLPKAPSRTLADILKSLKDNPLSPMPLADKLADKLFDAPIMPLKDSSFTEDSNAVAVSYEPVDENVEIIESDSESEETEENGNGIEEIEAEIEAKENLGKQQSFSLSVILNEDQVAAKEMAASGKSLALIGAAGTGKTLTQREVAKSLLLDDRLSISRFKTYDRITEERVYVSAPSIAFCAFTRRAAANLQKAIFMDPLLAEKLAFNVMTIHSLLEFEPETYMDYADPEGPKEKFRFYPKRTAQNPLNITHLIIEESSMLDAMTLWGFLYDALPTGVQIIFIGDINQLPPVFGPSILNYALVQLPVIELKKVYRNQGIVLENAHRILKGETLLENNNFEIVRGKQEIQVGQDKMSRTLGALFDKWMELKGDDGLPIYDPEDCMILSPWNKQPLGTDKLNYWIAQRLGDRRSAIVHEVIAGFEKLYLAVGDRVMYNKLDGIITDIHRNGQYHGKEPQFPGSDLTRFGVRVLGEAGKDDLDEMGLDYSNFSLEQLEKEKAERKMQCSHVITILLDNGKVETLSAAGDFGAQSFSLGYCLTVHKAQGSEWRKVFIILHKDHAVSLYRELFYTAVTRARTKVTIIAKDFVINKAIKNQRIKGQTIEDKIEYFNSGLMNTVREPIYATK